jgi:hypothetical protein
MYGCARCVKLNHTCVTIWNLRNTKTSHVSYVTMFSLGQKNVYPKLFSTASIPFGWPFNPKYLISHICHLLNHYLKSSFLNLQCKSQHMVGTHQDLPWHYTRNHMLCNLNSNPSFHVQYFIPSRRRVGGLQGYSSF